MLFEIKKQSDYLESLATIYKKQYKWDENIIVKSNKALQGFLRGLRTDIWVGIEFPYVDKVYRNSYYHYYSSKLNDYSRDCIRLSFFSLELNVKDFYDENKEEEIQNNFLGFLVIRPTKRAIIGRNILRPDIFEKAQGYYTTWTNGHAAVNGLKLVVKGFPHCSQDSEMMVCAETTIWSVVEYFSHKYPDYRQVLPHEINKVLSLTSMERQLPSGGLTGLQISFALKEFGFGVRNYTVSNEGGYTLEKIIKTIIPIYVESGIPVVTTIGAEKEEGHVFNVIGRTKFVKKDSLTPMETLKNGNSFYDYYEQTAEYIVIDDNITPYCRVNLNKPTCNNYNNYDTLIDGAIVPLHPKIYMEADKAHSLGFEWLVQLSAKINMPSMVLKTFLTSSRSYKHYIALNKEFIPQIKNVILSLDMPKFLWIIELYEKTDVVKDECCGMILVDATEPKGFNVLATFVAGYLIQSNEGKLRTYSLPLQPFKAFQNLKLF